MKKQSVLGAGLALSAMLALSACGPNQAGSDAGESKSLAALQEKYPPLIKNEGTPVDGATLKVGLIMDSGFKGIFNPYFYSDGPDSDIMKYTMMGAFPLDDQFKLIQDSDETPINVHIDIEGKFVHYKINPKFKWNDGSQVTTDDIIKTYEICANQEFIEASKSPRFSSALYVIQGIQDYNQGKADKISGLEKISDSEMKIHFTEMNPSVMYGGNTIGEFTQAKSVEDIAMKDIITSDAFRKNPPSYGPYVIEKILPGEQVTFKTNPYYFKGEPKVKTVEFQVIPPSQQVSDISTGGHDIYFGVKADVWDEIKDLKNISLGVRPDLYFSYLGFNQGHWDAEKNVCVFNPDAKMSNVNLKKALAYAIDNDALGTQYYSGLRFNATGPIAPIFTKFHDPKIKGYSFDLEKANKLLDDAGYKDVNGDGLREDPKGQPFEIHLAMMSGSEVQEPLSQYYLQQWKSIGINGSLVDGRLLDFNDFYERVQANDPSIDVYFGAFGMASDPDPTGYWGPNELFNMGRYVSEPLTTALNNISSPEALDENKQIQFYRDFEKTFFDEVPAVIQMNRVDFLTVNKRVKYYNFNWDTKDGFDWSKIELTAADPVANA